MCVCVYLFICVVLTQFFNNALVVGCSAESEVAEHVYDLILELHAIDSTILLSVMPQLEFKLKVRPLVVCDGGCNAGCVLL